MKKLFFALVTLILLIPNLHSQEDTDTYPKYEYSEDGDTLVIFTLEQTQNIDKKLTLYSILKEVVEEKQETFDICLKLVNESEEIIEVKRIKIESLENLVKILDKKVEKQRKKLNNKDEIIALNMKEIELFSEIIKLKDEEIEELKKKILWGGITFGGIITGLLALLIFL